MINSRLTANTHMWSDWRETEAGQEGEGDGGGVTMTTFCSGVRGVQLPGKKSFQFDE